MFSEEKPESLGALGEKVFYKTRDAGSNRRSLRKPEMLGANRRCLRKPELLGAVGESDVFGKQSTALADLARQF